MKKLIPVVLVLFLTACAGSTYRPLVDRPNADYESDLADCQRYAEGEAGAAGGAVAGALFGALLGAIVGHKTGVQGDFIRGGMIGGATGGAMRGNADQAEVIKNCMRGRGHSVLR